jgi:hypothetical protein
MCCQSKLHAVRALFAAVTLHVLCILLCIGACAAPFLTITSPAGYVEASYGRYSYVGERTVSIGATDLPLSFALPALAFFVLGIVLSILASVFICLRAYRLRRSLQGSSTEIKGCHTRAYTTMVLSILSTLTYIIGSCIIWGAVIPLNNLARQPSAQNAVAFGPGYSCASLVISFSIATSILEGVSHCCCKVKASPATSAQLQASTAPGSLALLGKGAAAPPGYVLAFLPAATTMQALPPLPAAPLPPLATALPTTASVPTAATLAALPA